MRNKKDMWDKKAILCDSKMADTPYYKLVQTPIIYNIRDIF